MQSNDHLQEQITSFEKLTFRQFFFSRWRLRKGFYLYLFTLLGFTSIVLLWASGFLSEFWQPVVGNDDLTGLNSNQLNENLPIVAVANIKLERGIKLPREYSGVLKSTRSSELGFKRTGQLVSVYADQGETVKSGQVLAELDTELLEASKKEFQAQLRGAEAVLAELMAGPRQQTIEFAKTQVFDLKAQLTLAQADYNRFLQLYHLRAISEQEFDTVRLRLSSINERLNGAEQQFNELQEGTRVEKIEAQRAVVAGIRATLQRIEVEISESQLIAPYNAVISQRYFDIGSIVGASMSVYRTVEQDRVEAWVGLPLEATAELVVNKSYPMTINQIQHYGQLLAISPELDPATRTLLARFCLPDPTSSTDLNQDIAIDSGDSVTVALNRLVPGQLVRLQMLQNINQTGFWVPFKSLTRGHRGLWNVFVVSPSSGNESLTGTLVNREIEIIQLDTDRVLVRGMLSDGEMVVTDGLHRFTAGQQVRFKTGDKSLAIGNAADTPEVIR